MAAAATLENLSLRDASLQNHSIEKLPLEAAFFLYIYLVGKVKLEGTDVWDGIGSLHRFAPTLCADT